MQSVERGMGRIMRLNLSGFFKSFFKLFLITVFITGLIAILTFPAWAQERAEGERGERGEKRGEEGVCVPVGSRCVALGERVIDGEKVYRECWEYDIEYDCFDEGMTSDDECLFLRNKGCEQLNSNCVEERSGHCIVHEQTFRCKEGEECTGGESLDCLQGTSESLSFCPNGDCLNGMSEEFEKNRDFGEAVSQLSAVFESAKNFAASFNENGGNNPMIFAGKSGECSMAVLGFKNCCRDHGWGLSLKLSDCPESAERVGIAKEKGQAVYIGKYCSHKVLKKCTEHKKSYCLFSSRLARIIQEEGRKQLDISWGSAKHPDCRGLTIEEIQQLHFDEMNFNEFFEYELKGKIHYPGTEEVNRLRANIEETLKHRLSHQLKQTTTKKTAEKPSKRVET